MMLLNSARSYAGTIFRAKSAFHCLDLARIFVELSGEGEWHAVCRQIGLAMFEGDADGVGEDFPVKFKGGRQAVQIVKILHAAVGYAQLHGRFELFRDDGLVRGYASRSGSGRPAAASDTVAVDRPGV